MVAESMLSGIWQESESDSDWIEYLLEEMVMEDPTKTKAELY
jgi:hypothetical protein